MKRLKPVRISTRLPRLPRRNKLCILLLGSAGNLYAAPTAIREQGFVRIGGIEQWITINGADRQRR